MRQPATAGLLPARRLGQIPFSPIRRVFEQVAELEAMGKDIINLGIGRPDFDTPDVIKDEAIAGLRAGHVHYTSNYGMLELREAIARFESRRLAASIDVDNVIVTVGANEAVFLIMMAFVDPGEEVLIPSPSWFHYDYCALLAGAEVVKYPLRSDNDFLPDPADIAARISERTKVLVVNSPHNPSGTVVPEGIMAELVQLARDHNILLLSDEIYSQLVYTGHRHASPLSAAGAEGHVVLVSGMSKAYSMTGWRIGYAVGARDVLDCLVRVHQYTVTCATSFAQFGAMGAFTPRGAAAVEHMRGEFERRRNLVLSQIYSIADWRVVEPGGAFYAFIHVGASPDGDEVARRLLHEAGVAVVPGAAFSSDCREYIRISYANSFLDLQEAFRRIKSIY